MPDSEHLKDTMPRKKLSRNAPCPCGKEYGKRCYNKGFEYSVDEEGNGHSPCHFVIRRPYVPEPRPGSQQEACHPRSPLV